MKCIAMIPMLGLLTMPGAAQTGSATAWSPAKSIGMFAYPRNQQSSDQQLKDESDCYGSAKQNTGIDPQSPAPATPSAQEAQAAQQQAMNQVMSQLSGFNGQIKQKDDVTVQYQLTQTGQGAPLLQNALQGKAKSDGEDVLTPLLQQTANTVLTQVSTKK